MPNATLKAIQNRNYLIAVMLFFAFLGGVRAGIGIGIAYHSAMLGAEIGGALFAALGAAECYKASSST